MYMMLSKAYIVISTIACVVSKLISLRFVCCGALWSCDYRGWCAWSPFFATRFAGLSADKLSTIASTSESKCSRSRVLVEFVALRKPCIPRHNISIEYAHLLQNKSRNIVTRTGIYDIRGHRAFHNFWGTPNPLQSGLLSQFTVAAQFHKQQKQLMHISQCNVIVSQSTTIYCRDAMGGTSCLIF